jgi:hypothetical protein
VFELVRRGSYYYEVVERNTCRYASSSLGHYRRELKGTPSDSNKVGPCPCHNHSRFSFLDMRMSYEDHSRRWHFNYRRQVSPSCSRDV